MVEFVLQRKKAYQKMYDSMPVRDRPSYEEERTKVMLRAKINLCEEILDLNPEPRVGLAIKKTYRVELVDIIDAESEHQAIDIFVQAIADIDISSDDFDVYEVDPLTRKAVSYD